jgi:DNA-binding response OmpR family regulator
VRVLLVEDEQPLAGYIAAGLRRHVLEQLPAADGAVVSAETLLDKVWDENADPFTNAVRITVGTLRRKLGEPPVIDTVTGAGYRLGR